MSEGQQNEESPYTQTRTQKSPLKQHLGNGLRNYGIYSHNSNLQLSYMKLKEQSKKQNQANLKQIELLKEELFRKNQQVQYLKSTVLMNLKKDLNDAQRDNIKNFKQIQKQAREIQKLRIDNFNMQQDLQKQTKQRRTYLSRMQDFKQKLQTTNRQIIEKDKIIRTHAERNKKIQKQLAEYKLQLQDLNQQLSQKQNRLFSSQNQYKAMLQKSFLIQTQIKTLHLKIRDNQVRIHNDSQKIGYLQKEKQMLLERVQQNQSRSQLQSDRQAMVGQGQIIEIKALMDQIYNLTDEKKRENKQINKKFLASIACLHRSLFKK